jgi:P-type Ca2+ transporter type 2C
LRTNRVAGLSIDEATLDGHVSFEDATGNNEKDGRNGFEAASISTPAAALRHTADAYSDRKRVYSPNTLPEKKGKTLLEIAWITYKDKILILLTIAAVISLALGLYQTLGQPHPEGEAPVEWVEGVAIMVAIILVVGVGTVNDWKKERQFIKLNKKKDDHTIKAVRSGRSMEIPVSDVVVGDVIHLEPGDIVPVDGIFIEGHAVKCDESSATGESDLLKKQPADEVYWAIMSGSTQNLEQLDPFIISGAKVAEGTGTFLVTSVGINSTQGRIAMALSEDQEPTPLQLKLNALADYIAKIGGAAALLLFVVLLVKFLVQLKGSTATPSERGQNFLHIFIVTVTVVVVAVPEGLPLAVTLALAFATTRMLMDNNLVRVLRACETMGNATTICSDKTGTLTQNRMTVVAGTIGHGPGFRGIAPKVEGEHLIDSEEKTINRDIVTEVPAIPIGDYLVGLSDTVRRLLVQAITVNSTAFDGIQDGKQTSSVPRPRRPSSNSRATVSAPVLYRRSVPMPTSSRSCRSTQQSSTWPQLCGFRLEPSVHTLRVRPRYSSLSVLRLWLPPARSWLTRS